MARSQAATCTRTGASEGAPHRRGLLSEGPQGDLAEVPLPSRPLTFLLQPLRPQGTQKPVLGERRRPSREGAVRERTPRLANQGGTCQAAACLPSALRCPPGIFISLEIIDLCALRLEADHLHRWRQSVLRGGKRKCSLVVSAEQSRKECDPAGA